ncbi:hypothetical protein GCM10025876_02030 [Demequina litorisediminis]|uniref:Uncharacterized protein n=1 Tax=Demequina litorisediminis TaxID=1849022 RepID=A0ABQ6I884_9MICO|nr:hypothetical protein GCM10025876_02030 [Demequina litorisediminis]
MYTELVSDASQLPWVLENAMRAAVEHSDVAVVVVPGDIFYAEAPDRRPSAPIRAARPVVIPQEEDLRVVADLLNASQRVTILAGAGAAGAHDEVVTLAGRLQAPIVHALRGKEHLEWENPYDVGMTGLIGFSSGYRAMLKADVLLILGSDFPYRQFYPEDATVIQVDLRGGQLGRRTALDVGLVGDVRPTARALTPLIAEGRNSRHLDAALKHYRRAREELDDLATDDGKTPIHPQYLTRLVSQHAASDAIFTADVGSPTVMAARYLEMTKARRLVGSFNHGSMANAMPQALGARRGPRPPGHRAGRRRGTLHAPRRSDHSDPGELAHQGGGLQQLVAELRRTGDEGRGPADLRDRPPQPQLRRGGNGHGTDRDQGRGPGRPGGRRGADARHRRAGGP